MPIVNFFKKPERRAQRAAQVVVIEPRDVLTSGHTGRKPDDSDLIQADELVDEQIDDGPREIAGRPPPDRLGPGIAGYLAVRAGQLGQERAATRVRRRASAPEGFYAASP